MSAEGPLLEVRAESAGDADFLRELYASTRDDLLSAGLPPERIAPLLGLQHEAREGAYAAEFPDADRRIVLVEGRRAGRLLLGRRGDALVVVDVALLPPFRSAGIGRRLLAGVMAEADGRGVPIQLSVERTSPARRLYARLGFLEIGGDDVRVAMERPPGGAPAASV